jgi:Phage integrase family
LGTSPAQAQHLLAVIKGHNLEALITLTLTTGMRHSELTGLQWSDIDFDEGSLSIRRTVNRLGRYQFVEGEPKTEQSRRKIMLSSFVLQRLKEHHVRQKEARLKAGTSWQDGNLVFCNRRGGFLHPDVLLRQFHKLLDEASLPRMRLHDLRHSAATILMAMKVPIKVIQELLGHSNITTTLNVYGHVLPSMQDEVVDKMERLFGQDEGDKIEFAKVASVCRQELASPNDELTAPAEGDDCHKTAPRASTPRLPVCPPAPVLTSSIGHWCYNFARQRGPTLRVCCNRQVLLFT